MSGEQLNQVANIITALAILCGALPLLIRTVQGITQLTGRTDAAALAAAEAARLAAILVADKKQLDDRGRPHDVAPDGESGGHQG
jgi:hypothetical protein